MSLFSGKSYLNGHFVEAKGQTFHSTNPATQKRYWQGQTCSEIEIAQAMQAASNARTGWQNTSQDERIRLVHTFAKVVAEQQEVLARIISEENGKPFWEAKAEALLVSQKAKISVQALLERQSPNVRKEAGTTSALRYKPLGIVVVLGPFNFPAHLPNGHILPALLSGNCVIYKPSELTPGVAEFIMQCFDKAGFPAGVVQCLQGDVQTAKVLLQQAIQGVFFTGSSQTGLAIHKQFAGRPDVLLALEMGGNNPLIIEEVSQMTPALYSTLFSAFVSSGQRCTCARRAFIPQGEWGDRFVAQLLQKTQGLGLGNWDSQPEPFMGPVISAEHAKKHLKAQENLLKKGAIPLLKMQTVGQSPALLSPGIIDISHAENLPDEEIFAPLLQIHRYRRFDEAIELANNTRYGLVAGLISDYESSYTHFYERSHAGLLNWNKPTTGASSLLPFGGIGLSGNHRPSAYFASDYCAYPVASQEDEHPLLPAALPKGMPF